MNKSYNKNNYNLWIKIWEREKYSNLPNINLWKNYNMTYSSKIQWNMWKSNPRGSYEIKEMVLNKKMSKTNNTKRINVKILSRNSISQEFPA